MTGTDTVIDVRVDTKQHTIAYRDFLIDESVDGWEWTHGDYGRGIPAHHVTGMCQTVFECIDAVDDWYADQP